MQRMAAIAAAALLAATILAGCSDGPGPAEVNPDPPEGLVAETPRWDLGQFWSYSVATARFPETETRIVYYQDDGNNYLIGSSDRDQAKIHALFNVNPQLGRIQKGNLAIYERGEPRALYKFPIRDGDTWSTDLFVSIHGGTLTARATYDPAIPIPGGTTEGFQVVAMGGDGFRMEYDFVPAIQWFTKLIVTDSEGVEIHRLALKQIGRDYKGATYFMRGDDLYAERYEAASAVVPDAKTDRVFVDGSKAKGGRYGAYDFIAYNVAVEIGAAGSDRAEVTIKDPSGRTVFSRPFTSSQRDEFRFQEAPAVVGEWTIEYRLWGTSSAEARIAGVWEYEGRL